MSDRVRTLEHGLKAEAEAYTAAQRDIAKNHEARQKFTQQLNENQMVLKEMELLEEENAVYKLIGPVLVKQDRLEATSNVQKRLDFIGAELDRLDSQLKGHQEKQSRREQQIVKMRQELTTMTVGKT